MTLSVINAEKLKYISLYKTKSQKYHFKYLINVFEGRQINICSELFNMGQPEVIYLYLQKKADV